MGTHDPAILTSQSNGDCTVQKINTIKVEPTSEKSSNEQLALKCPPLSSLGSKTKSVNHSSEAGEVRCSASAENCDINNSLSDPELFELRSPTSQKVRFFGRVNTINEAEEINNGAKADETNYLFVEESPRKYISPQHNPQSRDTTVATRTQTPYKPRKEKESVDPDKAVCVHYDDQAAEQGRKSHEVTPKLMNAPQPLTYLRPEDSVIKADNNSCDNDDPIDDGELPRGRRARKKSECYRKHTKRDQTPCSPRY